MIFSFHTVLYRNRKNISYKQNYSGKLKLNHYKKNFNQIIWRLFLYLHYKLDQKKKRDLAQKYSTELTILIKNICLRTRKYSKTQFPQSVL